MKGKQAHHRTAILELVRMMKLYQKNTKLSILIKGDGSEILEFGLPHPQTYKRNGDTYTIEYVLNGYFNTNKGYTYLNDIIARFNLSMKVLNTRLTDTDQEGIELNLFRGLKSITRAKNYERVDNGQDNVFWSIKLYTEALIKEHGEGELIPYSIIENYAFDNFIDRSKDKSTLRAKCRSIWNWYDKRYWTIPTRGTTMSRADAGKHAHTKLAEQTKAKVVGAIESLKFLQEKINIANVSRQAGVSRDTAKKYLIELGYK